MNRKPITLIILGIFGFVFFSCSPEMEIPSYIYIEDVQFSSKDEQGTASCKIPCVFITVNGTDIGCYQLPALIPVIASGKTKIQVSAGIKLNGLSQQQVVYPFYTIYDEMVNLTKERVDTLYPSFTYNDMTKFAWIENFEQASLKFFSTVGASLEKTNDSALMFHYPGETNNYSGIINVSSTDSLNYFEIKSNAINFNSNTAQDCFIELNYSFTEDVEVGIYCHSNDPNYRSMKVDIVNVKGNKNLEWNKIYVNLTDEMRKATQPTNVKMDYFEVYMKSGVPKGESGRFLFDNIKLVYR